MSKQALVVRRLQLRHHQPHDRHRLDRQPSAQHVRRGTTKFAGSTTANLDLGSAGEWVFIAATYDGTATADNLKFYLGDDDPNSTSTLVGTFTADAGPTVDSEARFGIGFTDAAPTSNQSLNGLQDDVRVYNDALSAADINAVRLTNVVPEPGGSASSEGCSGACSCVAAGNPSRRGYRHEQACRPVVIGTHARPDAVTVRKPRLAVASQ